MLLAPWRLKAVKAGRCAVSSYMTHPMDLRSNNQAAGSPAW